CHDAATPDLYTLSLHGALPISYRFTKNYQQYIFSIFSRAQRDAAWISHQQGPDNEQRQTQSGLMAGTGITVCGGRHLDVSAATRSEEHTSELQSRAKLVCRLLL